MSVHTFLAPVCRAVLKISGHRLCCQIPGWLAGPNWEPVDVKPLNPYNLVWRFGQILMGYDAD